MSPLNMCMSTIYFYFAVSVFSFQYMLSAKDYVGATIFFVNIFAAAYSAAKEVQLDEYFKELNREWIK